MTAELALRNGHAAAMERPTHIEQDYTMLDKYSESGLADGGDNRVNAIATISAGYRDSAGKVQRSAGGEIFIHGAPDEAPALRQALAQRDNRGLTVMFASDNPRDFVQQRFVAYSATKLLMYGDETEIVYFDEADNGRRRIFTAGSENYAKARAKCKVAVSVYFMLAEWNAKTGAADYVFDDGLGLYRLRFTSTNSLRSIVSSIKHVASMTRGRIAGIPFDLTLRDEEHADPTGTKRRVPIWQCRPMAPPGQRMTAGVFRALMESGQAQRELMALPSPARENELDAARDVEFEEGDVEALEGGGFCDSEHWRRTWFATVRGTGLDTDLARATFISQYTEGGETSLSAFLATATNEEALALINAAADAAPGWAKETAPVTAPVAQAVTPAAVESEPGQGAQQHGEIPTDTDELLAERRRWDALVQEGATYGLKPKPLPPGAVMATVRQWCEKLDERVVAARAEQMAAEQARLEAEAAKAEAEKAAANQASEFDGSGGDAAADTEENGGFGPFDDDNPVHEGEVVDEPESAPAIKAAAPTASPPTGTRVAEIGGERSPLSQAIRDKVQVASDPEGEAIFDRADDAPPLDSAPAPLAAVPAPAAKPAAGPATAPAAARPKAGGNLQPHTLRLIGGLKQSGYDVLGDLGNGPILQAVNNWYQAGGEATRIAGLDEMPITDVPKFLRAIINKAVKVNWPKTEKQAAA